MLGYGSFMLKTASSLGHVTASYFGQATDDPKDNPLVYASSQRVNILPILAYQKIYYDFFSCSQWGKHLAYAYNVDYWPGNASIALTTEMLKIRYANYPKDYFMGVLPNSQYGSVAALPVSTLSNYSNTAVVSPSSQSVLVNTTGSSVALSPAGSGNNAHLRLNADLSDLLS